MNDNYESIVRQLYQEEIGLSDLENRLEINSSSGNFDYQSQLANSLQLNSKDILVDVGCGTGKHLVVFTNKFGLVAHGCDPSINDETRGHVSFVKAKASELPYDSAFASKVMCNYAMYYEDHWQKGIEEMLRITSIGGKVMITGPASSNNQEFYGFHKSLFGDISEIDKRGLFFIDEKLIPYLTKNAITYSTEVFTNKVVFPSKNIFLKYYTSTSLFRMTCQSFEEKEIVSRVSNAVDKHFSIHDTFDNHKKIRFVTIQK